MKTNFYALILGNLLFCISLQAQITTFEKTYGGEEADASYSVQQTNENGYIIVGYTKSFPEHEYDTAADCYLIRTDEAGDTLWTRFWGGYVDPEWWTRAEVIGYAVEECSDSGFVVAGQRNSWLETVGSSYYIYLSKHDKNGELEQRTYWGRAYSTCGGRSVQQTADGDYVIVGGCGEAGATGLIAAKRDSNLTLNWEQDYFSNLSYPTGESVDETTDDGFIITGWGMDYNDGILLLKTDSEGDSLWAKRYGGNGGSRGYSVQQTTDGGYITTGFTESFGAGGRDVYTIRTDANGDSLWAKTYGGAANEEGKSIQQTPDGGYIIAGYTGSFGAGGKDVFLIKTDSNGNQEWSKTFGGEADDVGESLDQTSDGGYIISGWTYSFGAGDRDVYLIKTDPGETGISDGKSSSPIIPKSTSLSQNYPNPFNPQTTIHFELRVDQPTRTALKIFDLRGRWIRTLKDSNLSSGEYEVVWDGRDERGLVVGSNVYFYSLQVGERIESRKMLLLK